jgi:DNA-binding MarR family transcriptional regulator
MQPIRRDGERIIWLLRRAFHAVEAEKDLRLRSTGVSAAHYAILVNIGGFPGLTSAELARRLQVTPQNIAGLVSKLESTGWIERRTHPLHTHVRELHLTAGGRTALSLADNQVAELEESVVARLTASEADQLRSTLLKIESGKLE